MGELHNLSKKLDLQVAKSFATALRNELAKHEGIFAQEINVLLEDRDTNILQMSMSGRPPYDVIKVAYNGTVIMSYHNVPDLS